MKNTRKMICGILTLIMMAGFTACGNTEGKTDGDSKAGSYTEGTYTETVKGHNGDLEVEVSFDAEKITSVKVLAHTETAGISDAPIERIVISEDICILSAQSLYSEKI